MKKRRDLDTGSNVRVSRERSNNGYAYGFHSKDAADPEPGAPSPVQASSASGSTRCAGASTAFRGTWGFIPAAW